MKQRWLLALAVVLAYTAMAIAMLWPLPVRLGQAVPGNDVDIWQNTWNLWWVRYAVWEGRSPLMFTPLLFAPNGASLLFHTLSPTNTVMALPVTVLWGPVAAYGVLAIFSFIAAGIGGLLLSREVLEEWPDLTPAARWGAAFLGGTIFSFSSYHLTHVLGHLHMLSLQWVPFYAWALLRSWKQARAGRILLAVLFLVLVSWTDWYYCFHALAWTGLFVLVKLIAGRFRGRALWGAAGRVILVVAGALAVLAVQWVPMVREQARNPEVRLFAGYVVVFSADPLAYFTPGPAHPLWGALTTPLYDAYSGGNWGEGVLYLGLIPLSLAIAGAARRWSGRGFWTIAAFLFALLSLGPVLHWAGEIVLVRGHRVFLPYALLHLLPLMDIWRTPARFAMLVTLAVGVLGSVGAAGLLQRWGRSERRRLICAGVLALAVCAELTWGPFPTTTAHIPPFYRWLRTEGESGALLELPFVYESIEHTERMLYQTAHEHPIFGGYISRGDPHLPYAEIPGFRTFQTLRVRREITEPDLASWREQAVAALAHYNAGYVVLPRASLTPAQMQAARALAEHLLGAPTYEDAETVAYRVPAARAAFWEMGPGWGEWDWQDGPARLLTETAGLRLVLPDGATGLLCLRAVAAESGAALSVGVDGQTPEMLPIGATADPRCLGSLSLAAGPHEVDLQTTGPLWMRAIWWTQQSP